MKNIEPRYFQFISAAAAAVVGVVALLISAVLDNRAIGGIGAHSPALLAAFAAVLISAYGAVLSLFLQRRLKLKRVRRRVFIAYARADADTAARVSELLRKGGFDPWVDTEQLLPGQLWKEEIDRALEGSGAAVILVSKSFIASETASRELTNALRKLQTSSSRITPIVPVRLDDVEVPASLAAIQWINLTADDAVDRILRSLELATALPRARSAPADAS